MPCLAYRIAAPCVLLVMVACVRPSAGCLVLQREPFLQPPLRTLHSFTGPAVLWTFPSSPGLLDADASMGEPSTELPVPPG